MCKVSLATVREWIARGAPRKTKKGWDSEAILAWRAANIRPAKWTAAKVARNGNGEDLDPALFFSGQTSPALERWRIARAKDSEYELARKERRLIDREEMHALLVQISTALRSAAETLQRIYGPDARRILDEALDETDRQIEAKLQITKNSSGGSVSTREG